METDAIILIEHLYMTSLNSKCFKDSSVNVFSSTILVFSNLTYNGLNWSLIKGEIYLENEKSQSKW